MSLIVAIALQAAAPQAPLPGPAMAATVLDEINRLRAQPAAYAEELKAYRATMKGMVAYPEGYPNGVTTSEGAAAVDDAIDYLSHQQPMGPLSPSPLLTRTADALVSDQAKNGGAGVLTSDSRDASARSQALGGGVYVGEVIGYGPLNARDMVRHMLIDDGAKRRDHRDLIFSQLFGYVGAACAPHPTYRSVCAVDLSQTFDGVVIPGVTP